MIFGNRCVGKLSPNLYWTQNPMVLMPLELPGSSRPVVRCRMISHELHHFERPEITSGFSDNERYALFYGNAERIYRI